MVYVIRKDDATMKIMFGDVAYDVDPKDYRIIVVPLYGVVFNNYNVEVQKFLKHLTQGTKSWKWI